MQASDNPAGPLGGSGIAHGLDNLKLATDGSQVLQQNINMNIPTKAHTTTSFSIPPIAPAQPPPTMPQQEQPKRQICFDFTKNQCSRGANCKFSHDLNLIIQVNSQEKGICFDFLKGTCSRGPLCRFSHDLRNLQSVKSMSNPLGPLGNIIPPQNDLISALNRPNTAPNTTNTAPICYDFVKNQCNRGAECKYSHDYSSILMGPRSNATKNPYVMCMDFVRGRCMRGATCRYAHFDPLQFAAPGGVGVDGGVNGSVGYGAQAGINLGINNGGNTALAGLSQQQAQALLAAAAAAGGGIGGGPQQQQQQHPQQQQFFSQDGTTTWPMQPQDEYSLSLLQLQQLALQNEISNTPAVNGGNTNLASTAEDVLPLTMPTGPHYQQNQQVPNDVNALNILLLQQQQQRQQQNQLIRAHQRRPSNLGPSAMHVSSNPSSDNHLHHYVENTNSNAPAAPTPAVSMPLPTNLQQYHQGSWPVNFHHPLLQKVQSTDLRSGNLSRPGSGTYSAVPGQSTANSTIHSTSHSRTGSLGGTDSPTIRAAWGGIGPNTSSTTYPLHHHQSGGGMVPPTSAPTSQPGSFGAGSPLTDALGTVNYIQRQQQQQQQQGMPSQPGFDVLKSIWSTKP